MLLNAAGEQTFKLANVKEGFSFAMRSIFLSYTCGTLVVTYI